MKRKLCWRIIFLPLTLYLSVELFLLLFRQTLNLPSILEVSLRISSILLSFLLISSFSFTLIKKENKRRSNFQNLVNSIKDGIIIMDKHRKIVYINPSADRLTGWKLGEDVPYCSYCQKRQVLPGEERCLLARPDALSYFESEMPTYEGRHQSFQMSTAFIDWQEDGTKDMILVIRDATLKRQEEESKLAHLLIQETISAQEFERKRIAQELHDGVSQSLFSVIIGLQGIQNYLDKQNEMVKNHFHLLKETLKETLHEVKSISAYLRPSSLDLLGLIPTIKTLISQLHYDLQIELVTNLPEEERFSPTIELNVFRIIQEALHNAQKHSQATSIQISLMRYQNNLEIGIKDNGIGFVLEEQQVGLGLKHMKERSELLGGVYRLASQVGRGTTIECLIPVEGNSYEVHSNRYRG